MLIYGRCQYLVRKSHYVRCIVRNWGFLSFKRYSMSSTAPLRTPCRSTTLEEPVFFLYVLQELIEHVELLNHLTAPAWYLALHFVCQLSREALGALWYATCPSVNFKPLPVCAHKDVCHIWCISMTNSVLSADCWWPYCYRKARSTIIVVLF